MIVVPGTAADGIIQSTCPSTQTLFLRLAEDADGDTPRWYPKNK